MIYEQKMRLMDAEGKGMDVRRVTIELKKPTRDGETEIHLLTNLPAKAANARSVADLYLRRWTVEKAFHELDQALHGEIKTLGYPGAALLSFCVALLAYNVISVVKSALAAVHKAEAKREDLSGYYLAGELAAAYHGMMIAVPAEEWTRHFASSEPCRVGSPAENHGRQGPPGPLSQEHPRPEETTPQTNQRQTTSSCLYRSYSRRT